MPPPGELIGRERERKALETLLFEAAGGHGALLLVTGESGMGKTRLLDEVLTAAGARVVGGAARQEATSPYEPVVAALRSLLRREPTVLEAAGRVGRYLRTLLPELGRPPPGGDAATLVEALGVGFGAAAARGERPLALVLDDLQWADDATLELLPSLADVASDAPLLIGGVYRSDEIRRGHGVRRLRRDLRRAGRLRELTLEPLRDVDATALAERVAGGPLSVPLASALYDRTQGVPFFVEELAAALVASGRLREGRRGLELADAGGLPVPDTIRDAVLLRAAPLSEEGRAALEAAAVAGDHFELDMVVQLVGANGLTEPLEHGLVTEPEAGVGAFRHALVREAFYADMPWTRRRRLHALVAQRLEARGERPALLAEHWLAARDPARARPALVAAVRESAAVHAHRDALARGRHALEIWPEGESDDGRAALVEQVARSAELCGELSEAAAAWRELADAVRRAGDPLALGEAERRLATVLALQGAPQRSLAARRRAADAFVAGAVPAEAVAELLAAAGSLESAGSLKAALELAAEAGGMLGDEPSSDLRARLLGIEGSVLAKTGRIEEGLATIGAGLELALGAEETAAAVELYQRLANAYEHAADYRAAEAAYRTAYDFCTANDAGAAAQFCLACLGFLLWQRGDWERAIAVGREILDTPDSPQGARTGARQHLAMIAAVRGDARRARRLLLDTGGYPERYQRERMLIWERLVWAWIDELEGDLDGAADRCRGILESWGDSEARFYPVPALRWATTFLASHGAEADARACAQALAELAAGTVNPDALAALAHALGETALLDGDADRAAVQFLQAASILADLELPLELARSLLRAGTALAAAEERDAAVERLAEAYRIARRLGARPLTVSASTALAQLGERIDRRLGRRAAADLENGGLTRRELEIVRLVAVGRTNREIAQQLFLSPRTVDMHVHNILVKLGCRSRAEATFRVTELGLVGAGAPGEKTR